MGSLMAVSWLHSYITNQFSFVCIYAIYSTSFQALSGVAQGSVLGPLLFNIYINNLCSSTKHFIYFFFGDNLKFFCTVTSAADCVLLQTNIHSICGSCATNSMILSTDKNIVITFTRKTNPINSNYKLSDSSKPTPTALKIQECF